MFLAQTQFDLQHAQAAAAEQRQRAMRGNGAYGLGIGVVIAELLFLGRFLAFHHRGRDDALLPQARAQFGEQFGRLGKTLAKNVARAFERGFGVGNVDGLCAFGSRRHVHVLRRFLLRIERGIGEERIGQRLQPGLARNLRPRAALGLVGQIDIFQRLLGRGCLDGSAQFIGKFALLLDRRQDRRAPFFQFAQIQQPFFQIAQLRVVQVAGGLLAIARDEGHGRAFVEQRHRSRDLMRPDSEFLGNELNDLELCSF